MEWSRKSELSADRAGLLATQDPAVATRVHMKLASGGHLEDLDITSFFAQAAEYEETEDLRDSVLKLFLVEGKSHPFNVVRASELRRWTESGEYTAILHGTYPRREDDADAKVTQAAQDAARSYARPSSGPRTPSAASSTTSPASWAPPSSGSTRSSGPAAPSEPASISISLKLVVRAALQAGTAPAAGLTAAW